MTPFFENKSNVFVCCVVQGGIFCTAGEIFAVVGPLDATRSNAERSQPRAPALSKAGTDARTGREQSLQSAHSRHSVHTLPVPYYYNVHGCTTALLTPTTCTQRGPRGLISANPRGAPHASRESHNPAWQPGAFYHHHHFSSQEHIVHSLREANLRTGARCTCK